MGSRGGESDEVSSQTGGRPLPSPSCSIPKVSRVSPALLGHSPMASSFFPAAEDKKKKGTEQGGWWLKSIPQPHPSCQMVCSLSSVVRGQGRLLAGHSLVEVDVAQVLRWLLRGTHSLVIVDHPSGEAGGGGGRRRNRLGIHFASTESLMQPLELILVILGQSFPTFAA